MPHSFPAEAIRDALGALRLLYAARVASGRAMPGQSDPLIDIGVRLRSALTYANAPDGSPGQHGAIEGAAAALRLLAETVTTDDTAAGVARAAAARVPGTSSNGPRSP